MTSPIRNVLIAQLLGLSMMVGLPCGMTQKVEFNDQGERILRFDDGSWRYYTPADSIYLREYQRAKTLEEKILESQKELGRLQNEQLEIAKQKMKVQSQLGSHSDRRQREMFGEELAELEAEEEELKILVEDLRRELQLMQNRKKENEQHVKAMRPDVSNQFVKKRTPIRWNPRERKIMPIPETVLEVPVDCNQEQKENGERRVGGDLFLTYTPKGLRHKFHAHSYLEVYQYLRERKKQLFLELQVDIYADDAQSDYGKIEKGGQLLLELMDGTTLDLRSIHEFNGQKAASGKCIRYRPIYRVESSMKKSFQEKDIHRMRMVWSKGYEDYEVHYIDLHKKLLECLKM